MRWLVTIVFALWLTGSAQAEVLRVAVISDLNGSYGSTSYGKDVSAAVASIIAEQEAAIQKREDDKRNAAEAGATNVEFLRGHIESIPASAADWNLPGQLHAFFLRSDRAHAEIVSIDVSAALEALVPGFIAWGDPGAASRLATT